MLPTLKQAIIIDILIAIVLCFVLSYNAYGDANETGYYVGTIHKSGEAVYTDARNAVTGTAVDSVTIYLGQGFNGSVYNVFRVFMSFDIPSFDSDSLLSAALNVYGSADISATNFDIYILSSAEHATPLITADFDTFDGKQPNGAYNGTVLNDTYNTGTDIWTASGWNTIPGNSALIDSINAHESGTLKLVLLSKEDYDSSAPTENELVGFTPDNVYLSLNLTGDDMQRRQVIYSTTRQPIYDKTRIPLWKP